MSAAIHAFRRAFSAELVRVRRTTTMRLTVVGLVISVLQGLGWAFLSSRSLAAWPQLLAWQSVYATTLAIPLASLLGALTATRERRARGGGTDWRAVSPAVVRGARLCLAALQLLAFNLALNLPVLVWGSMAGLADPPIGRLLALAGLEWALCLAPLALGLVLGRWFGMLAAVGAAIVWQIAGTISAESSVWWAMPWTWQVRPLLPLLGVHANGVPLEPGSPVWGYQWWPATLGAVALLALLIAADRTDRWRPRTVAGRAGVKVRPRPAPLVIVRVRPKQTLALAGSLRGTALPWLVLLTVLALPAIALLWHADGVRGAVGYLVLPLGSCLLAVLVWQAQDGAFRGLATRRPVRGLGLRLLLICAGICTALAGLAGVLIALSGGDHVGEFIVVAVFVGTAGAAICLYLTTRFGAGAALGVTLVTQVLGLILGGYFASTPLWLAGPGAWGASATSDPLRATIACLLSLGAIAAAAPLWFGSLRRVLAGG